MFGDRDSACYQGHTHPFPFPSVPPDGSTGNPTFGYFICRQRPCNTCNSAPEYVPVHYDCLAIFRKACSPQVPDVWHRLWARLAWKRAWQDAPSLHLPIQPRVHLGMLKRVVEVCELPMLLNLPIEVLELIWAYLKPSPLWRCVAALSLADRLSSANTEPFLTVPFNEIQSWNRHGKLDRCTQPSSTPLKAVRLTIDSDGISRIERLVSTLQNSGNLKSDGRVAFVVVSDSCLSGAVAQLKVRGSKSCIYRDISHLFKDGLLRLHLPTPQPLPIWNTPAPPNWPLCKFTLPVMVPPPYLEAYESDKIRGITFFFFGMHLFDIHVHLSEDSSALSTYRDNLESGLQPNVVSVYLPITGGDRLLVLGVRKNISRNILVRTNHVGDVVIGSNQDYASLKPDQYLNRSSPFTFIHSRPTGKEEGLGRHQLVGAYRNPPSDMSPPIKPFSQATPAMMIGYGSNEHYSWAPLTDISSTRVFHEKDTGFCRGILIRYSNGGSRALGQCRLHVDAEERVVHPLSLSSKLEAYNTSRKRFFNLRLKFSQDPPDQCVNEDGWDTRPLRGVIKLWFNAKSTIMEVEDS